MAIPGVPFKLTKEDLGRPDLTTAIANGLKTGFLPRELPAELALKQANARSKNAYANLMMPQYVAHIVSSPAFKALYPEQQQKMIDAISQSINATQNPDEDQPIDLTNSISNHMQNKNAPINNQNNTNDNSQGFDTTPAQRSANYGGQQKREEEIAKNDAKFINDYENTAVSSSAKIHAIDELSDVLNDQLMPSIRSTPLAGRHEIAWYAKEGTPEQQELAGKFITDTNNLIIASIKEFPQRFTDKDLTLMQSMKINPGDTIDTAKGKLEALQNYESFVYKRAEIASRIMRQNYGTSIVDAVKLADKQIDGNKIRDEFHDKLHPQKIDRKHLTSKNLRDAAQKMNISVPDVIKRLKDQGINIPEGHIDAE